jgi:ABC-type glycerol-3-phosphate transport system permease component
MFATVILFGVKGKRRDWMMNWQFNWFGWSFQVAIVACILHLAAAMMAGYQGSNKYESKATPLHLYHLFFFFI